MDGKKRPKRGKEEERRKRTQAWEFVTGEIYIGSMHGLYSLMGRSRAGKASWALDKATFTTRVHAFPTFT